jgi:hypothetical protein
VERGAEVDVLPVPRVGRAPAPSPERGAALLRGAPVRGAPVRGAPVRARPDCPVPVRDGATPLLDPPLPDVGRPASPPPDARPRRSAPPLDLVAGRPCLLPAAPRPFVPLPRPAPPVPPERAPDPPEVPAPGGRAGRAGWARRFGRGEFGGIGRFYVATTCVPGRGRRISRWPSCPDGSAGRPMSRGRPRPDP